MHEELNKQISEFLDDELDQQEALRLLKKIKASPDLRNKLTRFEMIRHTLKNEVFVVPEPDFSARVSEAIRNEPIYLLPQPQKPKRTRKLLAAAASIAAVMVIAGSGIYRPITETQTASLMPGPVSPSSTPLALARQSQNHSINQRINDYLQAHNSSVYTNGQANFQPYARVTAYGQK
ncbi:MAG: sigma-E factor negative regulatory protein [Gammaproteobacteria bacterium]